MKTTLEIDDALYREVKAMSALTGRRITDLVSDGLRRVLKQPEGDDAGSKAGESGLAELNRWFKASAQAMKKAPKGPTARELLVKDRKRLEIP